MTTATCTFINPTTGKEYSGKNIERLQDAMDRDRRFCTGAFATFRQWLSVGRCVAKGEKAAARLLAFGDGSNEQQDGAKPAEKGKARFLNGFSVFALEQTTELADRSDPSAGNESTADVCEVDERMTGAHGPSESALGRSALDLEKLRAKAARLREQAAECHADRLSNTPKRLAQTMHKRMEGDRHLRAAAMLEALADGVAADRDHELVDGSARDLITAAQEAACFKCRHVSNGYHSYNVETTEPQHTGPLHVALRGLLDPKATAAAQAKAQQVQADAELRQCDYPGFFPTPPAVVSVMLEQAGDLDGKSVLEPSAGKGDLIRAALDAGAISVTAFECVPKLADYLARFVNPTGTQAVASQCADFLDRLPTTAGLVDVVLMNPPFERDAAPRHVLHALGWLKDGGTLVSVMPANWSEKSAADLLMRTIIDRGWDMTEMEIEGAAFNGSDAFRHTAVRTSLLIVRK